MTYTKTVWTDNVTPVDAAKMNNIETGIASLSAPAPSTTPPATPADGDIWYMPADAANGVIWQMRYNAGGSTYKWEFVGGPPLYAEVPTAETVVSGGTWVDCATVGPSITVPRAGDYVFGWTASCTGPATATLFGAGVALGATDPSAAQYMSWASVASSSIGTASRGAARGTLAAAVSLRLRYWANTAGTSISGRTLALTPVRVS